jgi:hypothetical protein
MRAELFLFVLFGASLALALWVDARWPRIAPKGIWRASLHVGISLLAAPLVVSQGLAGVETPGRLLAMLVGVVLPTLVYCMLAAVWLVKLATSPSSSSRA